MLQDSWRTRWFRIEAGVCRGRVRVIVSELVGWLLIGVVQEGDECGVYRVRWEEGGRSFQGVHPLEAVSATRSHMLFVLGWVGVGGWGRVTVI